MSDTTTTSSFVIEATAKNFAARCHRAGPDLFRWSSISGPHGAVRASMLGPVLEKLAGEYNGKFVLAKIDTDTESELALQFGVRSIPAVFAVRGGKAVDGFVGVQPEIGDPSLDRPAVAHARRDTRGRGEIVGANRSESRRSINTARRWRSTPT